MTRTEKRPGLDNDTKPTAGDAFARAAVLDEPDDDRAERLAALAEQQRQRAILSRARVFERDAGEALAAGYRFATYDAAGSSPDAQYRAAVLDDVKRWSADWSAISASRAGLVLFGPVGTGKDHLVFAAVRRLIFEAGISARLVNGRELAAECRSAIAENRPDSSIVSEYLTPDVLVLSDPTPPAGGSLSAYQADILYQVADGRAKRGRITCSTLNIASEQEADAKIGAPTWDRLVDGAWLIECAWSSYRRPAFIRTRESEVD